MLHNDTIIHNFYFARINFKKAGRDDQIKWPIFRAFEKFEKVTSWFGVDARAAVLGFTLQISKKKKKNNI